MRDGVHATRASKMMISVCHVDIGEGGGLFRWRQSGRTGSEEEAAGSGDVSFVFLLPLVDAEASKKKKNKHDDDGRRQRHCLSLVLIFRERLPSTSVLVEGALSFFDESIFVTLSPQPPMSWLNAEAFRTSKTCP